MSRLPLTATLAAALSCGLAAQATPSFTTSGDGCIAGGNVVYELFPLGAVIDLDGTSLTFVLNNQGSYVSFPSATAALPFGAASPSAIDINAADDTVQQRTLTTMTIPYVNTAGPASTGDIWIAPNGHVYLEANTDSRCCNGNTALADMLSAAATPAFSIYGCDINASATSTTGAGVIWFDEQNVGGQNVCVVTWDAVNEFGQSPALSHTFQMQLFDDGTVHFVYIQTDVASDPIVVGWSAGGGQPDLGSKNLGSNSYDLGNGVASIPVRIGASGNPVEGQAFALNISGISAGATAAAINMGTVQVNLPLNFIGSPGCTLYVIPDIISTGVVIDPATGTATLDLGTLPNDAGGAAFSVQGVVLDPTSATTFGVLSTDRGDVVIGDDPRNAAGVTFLADGANSFNSNTAQGFFSLTHNDPARAGLTITKLVVDAIPAGQNFDTNQTGMADRFDGGDLNTAGSCQNTYRNACAATTGLVWAGTDTSSCDPAATGTGYISSNPTATALTVQTLEFNFTDFQFGERFEFDADTDASGTGGDDMAGMLITVTFSDGSVASGSVAAIQADLGGVIL